MLTTTALNLQRYSLSSGKDQPIEKDVQDKFGQINIALEGRSLPTTVYLRVAEHYLTDTGTTQTEAVKRAYYCARQIAEADSKSAIPNQPSIFNRRVVPEKVEYAIEGWLILFDIIQQYLKKNQADKPAERLQAIAMLVMIVNQNMIMNAGNLKVIDDFNKAIISNSEYPQSTLVDQTS